VRNKVNISDPLTHAKLQAFIDWKIAMFELILIECPKLGVCGVITSTGVSSVRQ
jgi:hypothetical protein